MDPKTETTSGALAPVNQGEMPQVLDTHGYFFASYAVVWIAVLIYLLLLGRRIGVLEERVNGRGGAVPRV